MGNKEEKNKYKKDNEIELRIELDEYIFFPYGNIKGNIYLKKKKDIKYDEKELEIKYKLTQFQKYVYQDDGENSDKQSDTFKLKDEFYKCPENFLEKEEIIPIKDLYLPSDKKTNFFPTFEYRNKGYLLYVRHLLTIEIPKLKTSNSIGVIICKIPSYNNNLQDNPFKKFNDDFVYEMFFIKKGRQVYDFNIKKLNYSLNEEIPVKLIVNNTDLNDVEIDSIELILEKKLQIKLPFSLKKSQIWNKEHEKIITLFNKKYKGDEVKNKVIIKFKENLYIDKDILPSFLNEYNKKEKSEIARREIKRFTKFDENFLENDEFRVELNPSINTNLFLCEYKVKLFIHYSKTLLSDKTEEFLIDLYTLKPTIIDKIIEPYFNIKEHGSFEVKYEDQKDYNGVGEEKEELKNSGFINLEKKDYHLILNNKKND